MYFSICVMKMQNILFEIVKRGFVYLGSFWDLFVFEDFAQKRENVARKCVKRREIVPNRARILQNDPQERKA